MAIDLERAGPLRPPDPTRGGLESISQSRTLVVDATTRCNQDCVFCCEGNLRVTRPDMTFDEMVRLAHRAREEAYEVVTFIGGEITLAKWLLPAIEVIKSLGMRVTIVTNGTALASRSYASRLLATGIDAVQISVLSHRPADDERVSGLRRGFALRRLALAHVRELRPARGDTFALSVAIVITTVNAPDLSEMIEWLRPFGVDLYTLKMVLITESLRDSSIVPRFSDLRPVVADAMDLLDRYHLRFRFEGLPLCVVPARHHAQHQGRGLKRGFGFAYDNDRGDLSLARTFERPGAAFPATCAQCTVRDPCCGPQEAYVRLFGDADVLPVPSPQ